ncbi:MAG: ABC transporter permease [Candidatus Nanoarchaeia archaeon]|nr:ABC transporter permease [Candidatus Nanoarchaeia archaeon]
MIVDIFSNALKNILKRKTRSWLTILGIVIGIAAIVALLGIGGGLRNAIVGEFESVGVNRLIILSSDANLLSGPPMLSESGYDENYLNQDWFDVIKRAEGVEMVGGFFGSIALIEGKDDFISVTVNGIPKEQRNQESIEDSGVKLLSGRFLTSNDKNAIMINNKVAENTEKKINNKIEIMGKSFKVVGIYESSGFGGQTNVIYMPIESVYEMLNAKPKEISSIFVKYNTDYQSDFVIEEINRELRRYLKQKEGEESFQIQSYEEFLKILDSVLSVINYILVGIAMISTLVAAIGIMNSLFTSVMERRREIGIMKSIGARNSSILSMFVIESILFSVVGGIVGIGFGILLAKLVENIAFQVLQTRLIVVSIQPSVYIFSLIFSIIVGVLSGFLPAKKASKMNPVDSLS